MLKPDVLSAFLINPMIAHVPQDRLRYHCSLQNMNAIVSNKPATRTSENMVGIHYTFVLLIGAFYVHGRPLFSRTALWKWIALRLA